ncbi:MAG: putative zinc protease [Candidatus Omnitrophica bacterium]|nr:putative zinc protease [Candidatus Omnitrophota bacterium]
MKREYSVKLLPNGVRLVWAPLPGRRSVSVGIWVSVGGRDESPELSGASHFLEHLVFKGTHRRTTYQIKEDVEGKGGSLNAFTGEEYTCFLAKTTAAHFRGTFDVLADMVTGATLRTEDLEKERTVILEEIKMTQDQPGQLVDEILCEVLWDGHALGRPIAGTLKTVGAMTREQIVGFRDRYYRQPHLTVSAAGDIDLIQLSREVLRAFARPPRSAPGVQRRLFSGSAATSRVRSLNKKTEQTHLCLGMHALPKDHPDELPLDLLNVVLGGNMSSRLFNEVREERGLAYDIGSSVRRYTETGAFIISAGVDGRKAPEAVGVVLKELSKIATTDVGPDELRRAKDFYLGQLDLGLENTMNLMLWAGESVLSSRSNRTLAQIRRRVEAIRPHDLKRVAARLFRTQALRLALVGPDASRLASEIRPKLSL